MRKEIETLAGLGSAMSGFLPTLEEPTFSGVAASVRSHNASSRPGHHFTGKTRATTPVASSRKGSRDKVREMALELSYVREHLSHLLAH